MIMSGPNLLQHYDEYGMLPVELPSSELGPDEFPFSPEQGQPPLDPLHPTEIDHDICQDTPPDLPQDVGSPAYMARLEELLRSRERESRASSNTSSVRPSGSHQGPKPPIRPMG